MSPDDDNPILQASAVPYRRRDGRLEFCLITSASGKRWGFPKGIIDPGETPEQTACKEAQEEAGLWGRIVGDPLGQYDYRKWGTVLVVTVYLMEVTHADDDWEEALIRDRVWRSADQTREMLDRQGLLALFNQAFDRLAADHR